MQESLSRIVVRDLEDREEDAIREDLAPLRIMLDLSQGSPALGALNIPKDLLDSCSDWGRASSWVLLSGVSPSASSDIYLFWNGKTYKPRYRIGPTPSVRQCYALADKTSIGGHSFPWVWGWCGSH